MHPKDDTRELVVYFDSDIIAVGHGLEAMHLSGEWAFHLTVSRLVPQVGLHPDSVSRA